MFWWAYVSGIPYKQKICIQYSLPRTGEIVYSEHARFTLWMTLRCKTWQKHLQKLCMIKIVYCTT